MKLKGKKFLILGTYPLSIFLIWWAKNYPYQLEFYYTQGFYAYSKSIRSMVFDFLPFSFGDLFYIGLVVWFFFLFRTLFFLNWRKGVFQIVKSLGVLLLWFQLSWGLNYYRLEEKKNTLAFTENDLIEVTTFLVEESNKIHKQLSPSSENAIHIKGNTKSIIQRINHDFPEKRALSKTKISLFSTPLSFMGFSGYLNPFTLEAQINGEIPKISLPITIAHEMAHQQGHAAEDVANFEGFIRCYTHPDFDIRYAALLFAYQKCYRTLHSIHPEKAKELNCKLNSGIIDNFRELISFWQSHRNPLEPYFKSFYDYYLKANHQPEGIESYDKVVGQIISYFKETSTDEIFTK